MLIGMHYAIVAGTVCSQAVMRYVRGEPRLRFMLSAALPGKECMQVFVDAIQEDSLDVSLYAQRIRGEAREGHSPIRVPVACEPPLAQELEPICTPGLQLLVAGHFGMEQRQGLSVLEVVAEQAWRL